MKRHDFINSNPAAFDSNCSVCGGKNRDSVHQTKSFFDAVKDAGIPHSNHETDLYIPANAQTRELLRQFPLQDSIKETFTNQVEGGLWFDIPFAYLPAWERKNRTTV